jgi:hypothetical protein
LPLQALLLLSLNPRDILVEPLCHPLEYLVLLSIFDLHRVSLKEFLMLTAFSRFIRGSEIGITLDRLAVIVERELLRVSSGWRSR